jgi:ubiquinone/menaquinone biosynthesis C-methylase UbiE
MQEHLRLETERLKQSWSKHDRATLRSYLVQDVQDPRINVQSILMRGWLTETLFGEKYSDLAEHELRFALVTNWIIQLFKQNIKASNLHDVLDALLSGKDKSEGMEIPSHISETFATLKLPNYICDLLIGTPFEIDDMRIPEHLLSTFQRIWSEMLADEQVRQISVLEPACGSANDYRYLDAFGIAQFINYTGFDLCEKNISNARQMFPNVSFNVGNALEIDAQNNTFDYCFVNDLFEHLSVEAMETTIYEICRVSRKGLCIGFFNMYEGQQHIVSVVDDYHWNKLSRSATKTLFEQLGCSVEVIHIDDFLTSHFNCRDTHNKNAYTFVIKKSIAGGSVY